MAVVSDTVPVFVNILFDRSILMLNLLFKSSSNSHTLSENKNRPLQECIHVYIEIHGIKFSDKI